MDDSKKNTRKKNNRKRNTEDISIIFNNNYNFKEKWNENKVKYCIKIFNFCLFCLFYFLYKSSTIKLPNNKIHNFILQNYDKEDETNIIDKYYQLCENGTLFYKIREKRRINPQISIIVPIFNNEIYIKRIMTSIENQSYKDVEIIFVDDCSTDNSIKEIEKYKRRDKRIKIIKHTKKEGLFITRNDGVLNSNGEYVLFIEPNGILIEDILKKIFGALQMYETDIIKFDTFNKYNETIEKMQIGDYLKKYKIIYQPDILKLSFCSFRGELLQNNLYLWGKAIKRDLYINIINKLNDNYKKQNWNLYEDAAIYFFILKNSTSYIFINENGYINDIKDNSYIIQDNSYTSNEIIKDIFLLAEIFFDYTEDNMYEKLMALYQLKRLLNDYKNDLEKVNKGFDYYYKVLDKFSNCTFISPENQYYINDIKQILKKVEK